MFSLLLHAHIKTFDLEPRPVPAKPLIPKTKKALPFQVAASIISTSLETNNIIQVPFLKPDHESESKNGAAFRIAIFFLCCCRFYLFYSFLFIYFYFCFGSRFRQTALLRQTSSSAFLVTKFSSSLS